MTTTQPLTSQITLALAHLRAAKWDGSMAEIRKAQHRFDALCDQLPRTSIAQENSHG